MWIVSQMEIRTGSLNGIVPDTNWKICAMGDLDRDGFADYIWRHVVDGRVTVWLRRSSTNVVDLPAVSDTNWQLVGPR